MAASCHVLSGVQVWSFAGLGFGLGLGVRSPIGVPEGFLEGFP